MKLHHKEWPSVILTKTLSKGENHEPILETILPSNSGTWRNWDSETRVDALYLFRSKNRYFQFTGPDEKLPSYFEDLIFPRGIVRGNNQLIEYPVYCVERCTSRAAIIVLSAPYAGLLGEIVGKLIRPKLENGLAFARPLITEIYEMARQVAEQGPPLRAEEALSPKRTSVILRGGRITLTVDSDQQADASKNASIRSLTLMGTNILKSELFSRLVDEGIYGLRFGLDPSLIKVAFKKGNALGVIVKMDQFGNFHFRPGFGGKNLDGVVELIAHCMAGRAVETSFSIPLGRTIEGEL